jgi:hypothetical protein
MYLHNKLILSPKCKYYLLENWSNMKRFNLHTYHSFFFDRGSTLAAAAIIEGLMVDDVRTAFILYRTIMTSLEKVLRSREKVRERTWW